MGSSLWEGIFLIAVSPCSRRRCAGRCRQGSCSRESRQGWPGPLRPTRKNSPRVTKLGQNHWRHRTSLLQSQIFALLFIVTTNQVDYHEGFFFCSHMNRIGRLQNYELSSKTKKQLFLSGRQRWQILVQPNNIGLTTGLWQLRRAARH